MGCSMPSFLLGGLGGRLGDLSAAELGLLHGFDDADGDSLLHVTDGEAAEGLVLLEGFHTHLLGGDELDDAGVSALDELGVGLEALARSAIKLLLDLLELAGDVGGMAIQHRRVASVDLTGVVHHDHLSFEGLGHPGWVVLGVSADEATLDLLDGYVLDVESDVVSGEGLRQRLVVHLHRLDLSGDVAWGEEHDHAGLDGTGLNTAHGNRSNTSDLVDVLEGQTESLLDRSLGLQNGVQGLEEGLSTGIAFLAFNAPSLEPTHLVRGFQHVVSVPSRDGDESNGLGVVADLLDVRGDFLDDFLEAGLVVLGGVHLVDGNDELLHTEGVAEQGVLTGLSLLGDTGLELSSSSSNHQHGAVSLRGSCDHVLDEVTMSGGVNDGDTVLAGLELPESDVDGDTTFTLGLQLVQHPGIFEGSLSKLSSLLLELLDGTLVDSTALVNQMSGGGGLAGIYVTDDNDVDVLLILSHV